MDGNVQDKLKSEKEDELLGTFDIYGTLNMVTSGITCSHPR